MELESRFASRLYADASAQVHSSGVFGAKVIAINPGNPDRGPLESGRLRGVKSFGMDQAVAELRDTASEVKKLAADAKATSAEARALFTDVRTSDGTIAKLLKDDDLYHDLKEIAGETKALVKRTDKAIDTVDSEMANLKGFVSDGRETLRSVRQGTDAISRMPIIRGYVQDANALLVRPAHSRSRMAYNARDLFQPGTAIITDSGRSHLNAVATWLKGVENDGADVVVVAFADPDDPNLTPGSATEVTRKQSEVVIEFLKEQGVHKLGWTTRRKMTPLGMGMNPSPVVEKDPLPASHVQVLLFTP
jgi:ABC-type transporter Mla subunit MlaD